LEREISADKLLRVERDKSADKSRGDEGTIRGGRVSAKKLRKGYLRKEFRKQYCTQET